jgi:hypothetical protein
MARSMLSLNVLRLGLVDGEAEAGVEADVTAAGAGGYRDFLMIWVKALPRLESMAAFLCLIECHLECRTMKI